jgi:hypothetical protein
MFLLFLLVSAVSYAQNNARLIPRIIYVGDPAALVVSLPGTEDNDDIILMPRSPHFPTDENIDFHRIVLERRATGNRLIIEFTAFVPGILELPVIEIAEERFAGLTVTVNSIIDTSGILLLSRPASSLAMPGTSLMLYGTMAAFVFLFLLILWFVLKGRTLMQKWIEKWKRRQLFSSMKTMEKRLQKSLQKGADKRNILDKLSIEFRIFLSILTENNCRAMAAHEFEMLPELFPDTDNEYTSVFLAGFFRRCDEIRFSGGELSLQPISRLLTDLRLYLAALEKAVRKKREAV